MASTPELYRANFVSICASCQQLKCFFAAMTRLCLLVDSGEYEMHLGVDGMRRGRWRGPADTADDESMFQAGIA